jgi:hypothetical protein
VKEQAGSGIIGGLYISLLKPCLDWLTTCIVFHLRFYLLPPGRPMLINLANKGIGKPAESLQRIGNQYFFPVR